MSEYAGATIISLEEFRDSSIWQGWKMVLGDGRMIQFGSCDCCGGVYLEEPEPEAAPSAEHTEGAVS